MAAAAPRRTHRVAHTLGLLLLLLSVSSLIGHFLRPPSLAAVLLACAVPYASGLATLSAIVLIVSRTPVWSLVASSFAVLLVTTQLPLYLPSATPRGPGLIVVTSNMRFGSADPAALLRLVVAHRADILALEEMTPGAVTALERAGVTQYLPYHLLAPGPTAQGVGLFSRLPLSSPTQYQGFTFHEVSAVVHIDQSPVTVFATHMVAPWPGPAKVWSDELARLHRLLLSTHGLTVDAGDFNATLDHAPYRRLLTNGFHDSADQVGTGLHPTYPSNSALPPVVAIDHVLTRGFSANGLQTVRIPDTDHRTMVVRLVARQGP